MAISGIENINIGLQNQAAGSDSLYTAFNKSQNNFTTLFSCASPTTNFVAGNGVSVEYSNSNTYLTITNTGVTNLVAGDDSIVLTQSNGNVIITAPGGGNGSGGVSNINVIGAASGARITSTGGPIISNGIITLDLANSGVTAGTYTYPTLSVDQYGRVTSISNASSTGTVTSVGVVTTGVGIQISGSPVTTSGNISIINTGVTRLNAGTGIALSSSNGNITVSMTTGAAGVTSVGISSTSLDVTNSPITSTGTMTVNLPTNTAIVGNLTVGNNLTVTGNTTVSGNLTVTGNTIYYNVTSFNVQDPIISLGGGPNGNALTSNDGKDRGTALQYYTTAPVTAFMGWDNGNGEFSFGSNVTIASEVVTYNNLGNVRGLNWLGNVVGTNANLTTGNMTTGNITTINSGLMQNGNSNISIVANSNVAIAVASSNIFVVTSTGADITGIANVSGNIYTSGNVGIRTSTPDSELNILAIPQTVSYSLAGNSTTAGTDLHISGADGANTRITQDAFGLGSYVAFTGRTARGTAATPTQSLSNDILAQYTARGFSNGSLQFGNLSTGRVDIVANENFTDTTRATKVVVYTTPTGTITPVATANFEANGAVTLTGQVISTLAAGTAPFVVTSTTQVANLNVATAGSATNAAAVLTNTSTATTVYLSGVTSSANGNSQQYIVTGITANFGANSITATTFNGNLSATNATITGNTFLSTASGNVGIGTSSPSKKLEVYANVNSLQIESIVRNDQTGTGVAAIGFNVSGSAASEVTSTKAGIGLVRSAANGVGSLAFYNNVNSSVSGDFTTADERMRIDSVSGNVGIAQINPAYTLDVTGNIRATANIIGANFIGPLANGNSNVNIATANGNVTIAAVGNTTMTITGTGANIAGTGNITGNLSIGGFTNFSAGAGISAAGTVQANATAITKDNNQVTVVAAGSGVVLPTAVAGMRIFVRNAQATNALLVYPAVGGTINLLAANAAFSLALSTSAVFYAVSATQWYT